MKPRRILLFLIVALVIVSGSAFGQIGGSNQQGQTQGQSSSNEQGQEQVAISGADSSSVSGFLSALWLQPVVFRCRFISGNIWFKRISSSFNSISGLVRMAIFRSPFHIFTWSRSHFGGIV